MLSPDDDELSDGHEGEREVRDVVVRQVDRLRRVLPVNIWDREVSSSTRVAHGKAVSTDRLASASA